MSAPAQTDPPAASHPVSPGLFTETANVRKKHRAEAVAKWVFFAMALAMIILSLKIKYK